MSRRTDLEEYMHDSYEVIRECEQTIRTSDRPQERQRMQREVDRQWALIEGYLAEYRKLRSTPWPEEIAELAAHFAVEAQTGALDQHKPAAPVVHPPPQGQTQEPAQAARHSPSAGPSTVGSPIRIQISARDGKEMVYVPAGAFLYGQEKRERIVEAFWIDRTPVTNAEYARFVRATRHEAPRHWQRKTFRGIADHPVVYVNWHDANAYAKWAGKQLPAEDQWEKAARGTDGRTYPWGDGWQQDLCNTRESSIGGTTLVGRYSPAGDSSYGCADMAGNVYEWTAGEQEGFSSFRVLRGGSWRSQRGQVMCVARAVFGGSPNFSGDCHGFRCVSPISPSEP